VGPLDGDGHVVDPVRPVERNHLKYDISIISYHIEKYQ
jgi:hypothetical protein